MSKFVSGIIDLPSKLAWSKYEVSAPTKTLIPGIMMSDSDLYLHFAPGLIELRTFWSQ